MKNITLILLILLFLIGCKENTGQNNISEVVKSFVGKELVLPDSLEIFYPKNFEIDEYFMDYTVAVVAFIDGNCSKCAEDILKWGNFIKTHQMCEEVSFCFYVGADSYWSLENFMNKNKIPFPIFKDPQKKFIRQNNLHSNSMFHSFLLIDKKIVLIGNPMKYEKILDLYMQEMRKELECESY
ncbi:hypothetical protein [Marinifilum caeruleilacunae]|uniref:Redoxin domain-containing protein n=1 Tax=Marinifilum caeruleilacunae TaxID=2499076 RepID=A0ABX1X0T7_9BACT|nr:hypothetical protein [Marinifilum caeruleilacunae]NOU62024.1 redoxin domain-containing protein [Marinifilum caeruleilacunae]